MKCRKCNNYIPESVGNCPHCKAFCGLSKESHPMIDKYGLPTKIIPIDAEKNDTRERYIDYKESKKPSYQHQTPKSISKNDNINELCKAFPAIAFYVFIPASALFSTIFPKYKIFIACVVFFLLNFISLSILQKLKKKTEAEIKIDYSNLMRDTHKKFDKRSVYYESEKVIGFSIFDHMKYENEMLVKYYTFYEIDRSNIKNITYDTETACYIIHTLEPIYQNYSQAPTNELYWADIFNDTVLTNALKHSLPAKNMNF